MVNHPNRNKAKFHEGQEVEVTKLPTFGDQWRKAKIDRLEEYDEGGTALYSVVFPDGTRGIFGTGHIRVIK